MGESVGFSRNGICSDRSEVFRADGLQTDSAGRLKKYFHYEGLDDLGIGPGPSMLATSVASNGNIGCERNNGNEATDNAAVYLQ